MWRQTILFSLLIWISGLVVGNLIIGILMKGELFGLAVAFSSIGSLLPLVIVAFIIRSLVTKENKPLAKALILGAYSLFITMTAVTVLFVTVAGQMEWQALVYALPYVLGLWVGIGLGYKKYLKTPLAQPRFETLIDRIGIH